MRASGGVCAYHSFGIELTTLALVIKASAANLTELGNSADYRVIEHELQLPLCDQHEPRLRGEVFVVRYLGVVCPSDSFRIPFGDSGTRFESLMLSQSG